MVRREVKELIAKQVDGIVYVTAHERALKCLPENLTVPEAWPMDIPNLSITRRL